MLDTQHIQLKENTKEVGVKIIFITEDSLKKRKTKIANFALLEELGYKAKGNFYVQTDKILYVGLDDDNPESYANAACLAIKSLRNLKITQANLDLKGIAKEDQSHILQGFLLGGYEYNGFKTKKDDEKLEITINLLHINEKILHESQIICKSVNFVRDIVNTPPNIANSVYLSELAQNITMQYAKKYKNAEIQAIIRSNSYMEEQKMGAFLAVNQASNFPAFLAHLSYKPKDSKSSNNRKKIAIVGKGLVYDTGGLSLKPADYMTTMKADKGGACAVLGAFLATIALELDIELHAIMGITDNAIGKSAYRPDDVLISREKKSIEVKNTDAEGRLVLADCLSYAQDLDVDIIIDFATLTGACVVALGEYTSGVMGYNEDLKQKFVESALKSGELAHTLPFNKHLKKLIESKIADVSNVSSSRYGGAITAGMFLGEFIREEYKEKWLHIDIAGPAYVEKEWSVNPSGASGIGVRACVEFLKSLS
ncbi:leucyl aminopeptidase [Helicobacter didelphidarum]|uniref:Probable cytosol aminopeptidase n=1 Tax=Helicobacter didelphidarum TaxID=2040648 RepID=A0A3D8IQN8_9HELI|nr:leucyl aminopeptidase [Helicobacter didelphidarum]RDU67598.1 leucyl aminopeptidase [Helicobacter didelphidarum]